MKYKAFFLGIIGIMLALLFGAAFTACDKSVPDDTYAQISATKPYGLMLIAYERLGYCPFYAKLSEDAVDKVTIAYSSCCGTSGEYELDVAEAARVVPMLDGLRVYSPRLRERRATEMLIGRQSMRFCVYMKDGSVYTVEPYEHIENDSESGYYFILDGEKHPVYKDGRDIFWVAVNGWEYDVREESVYNELTRVLQAYADEIHASH